MEDGIRLQASSARPWNTVSTMARRLIARLTARRKSVLANQLLLEGDRFGAPGF